MATRFFKPKIDKYIQLYSKYAYVEEGVAGTGKVKSIFINDGGFAYDFETTVTKPIVTISPPDEADGTQATAVVTNVNKSSPFNILEIQVTNEGSGYKYPPNVTITAPSFDNDANDTNDGITQIYVGNDGGSGYFSGTTIVTISPPHVLGGVQATAHVVITNGVITQIVVDNAGNGYNIPPLITISSPFLSDGVQATAFATVYNSSIVSITLTEAGSGYYENPFLFIDPPNLAGGTQATASLVIENGVITDVNIINRGSGYTENPNVVVKGGYGSGAEIYALLKRGTNAEATAIIEFEPYTIATRYVWELESPVIVDENALIQVVDRQFTGIASADIDTPIVIRMHELSCKSIVNTNNRSRHNPSFNTGSIVDIGKPDRKLPNDIKLEIQPQNIHKISLSLNQGLSTFAGISTSIEFVIILKITEKEPTMLEYGSLNNINVNQI